MIIEEFNGALMILACAFSKLVPISRFSIASFASSSIAWLVQTNNTRDIASFNVVKPNVINVTSGNLEMKGMVVSAKGWSSEIVGYMNDIIVILIFI